MNETKTISETIMSDDEEYIESLLNDSRVLDSNNETRISNIINDLQKQMSCIFKNNKITKTCDEKRLEKLTEIFNYLKKSCKDSGGESFIFMANIKNVDSDDIHRVFTFAHSIRDFIVKITEERLKVLNVPEIDDMIYFDLLKYSGNLELISEYIDEGFDIALSNDDLKPNIKKYFNKKFNDGQENFNKYIEHYLTFAEQFRQRLKDAKCTHFKLCKYKLDTDYQILLSKIKRLIPENKNYLTKQSIYYNDLNETDTIVINSGSIDDVIHQFIAGRVYVSGFFSGTFNDICKQILSLDATPKENLSFIKHAFKEAQESMID